MWPEFRQKSWVDSREQNEPNEVKCAGLWTNQKSEWLPIAFYKFSETSTDLLWDISAASHSVCGAQTTDADVFHADSVTNTAEDTKLNTGMCQLSIAFRKTQHFMIRHQYWQDDIIRLGRLKVSQINVLWCKNAVMKLFSHEKEMVRSRERSWLC